MIEDERRESLAVVVVSYNSAGWLSACLSSLLRSAGQIDLDVVVVDSGSTDNTRALVADEFPSARILSVENRGFGHANNRALRTIDARWILLLNPDTEFVAGTLSDLVGVLRTRPEIGVVAVRQVTPDGRVFPTIRRFPNALRSLFEALGSERFPLRASWLGERELDLARYETETPCDWTSGAFMLLRREALESAGYFDERFFLYCEETDLCLRIKQAGWEIMHLPQLTIIHHVDKAVDERLEAQAAYARKQYMGKHFSPVHRAAGLAALALGYGLRSVVGGADPQSRDRRRAGARAALAALLGLVPPPFGQPAQQARSGGAER